MGKDNVAAGWVLALLEKSFGAARRHWRMLALSGFLAAITYVAVEVSDKQGRFDIPYGYAVRMTCEPDPESTLWSGGCDRIAADIARTDKPSFVDLYRAFRIIHHTPIPSPETVRRFADVPCAPGFDAAALRGTRFVLEPTRVRFAGVCTPEHAEAIKQEIDARDRALLAVERAGLSHAALFAGALANISEPLVLFAIAAAFGAAVLL